MSQLQKSNLLRLLRRYTRNDRKGAICLCERSEAIPLLNTFEKLGTPYQLFQKPVCPQILDFLHGMVCKVVSK
jgi:hypothetical protein